MKTNEYQKKKEYIAPKMEILKMASSINLLQASCNDRNPEACYAVQKQNMSLD